MNIPCEVISDLLPLYIEDMESPQSKTLVEEHLSGCEACTKEMENLKALRLPIQTETESLSQVKKSIGRKRWFAVLTAVMLVITLVVSASTFLNATISYPSRKVLMRFVLDESEGKIMVYSNRKLKGLYESVSEEERNVGVLVSGRMIDYLLPNPIVQPNQGDLGYSMDFDAIDSYLDASYWYVNVWNGRAEKPLFPNQGELPAGQLVTIGDERLIFCCGTLLGAMVFGLLGWWMKGKWKRGLVALSCFFLSMTVGVILYSGGQLLSPFDFGGMREIVSHSLIAGLPLFVTTLCGLRLREEK